MESSFFLLYGLYEASTWCYDCKEVFFASSLNFRGIEKRYFEISSNSIPLLLLVTNVEGYFKDFFFGLLLKLGIPLHQKKKRKRHPWLWITYLQITFPAKKGRLMSDGYWLIFSLCIMCMHMCMSVCSFSIFLGWLNQLRSICWGWIYPFIFLGWIYPLGDRFILSVVGYYKMWAPCGISISFLTVIKYPLAFWSAKTC